MIGAAESGGEIDGVGRFIRPKTPTRWGWGAPSCGRDQPFGSLERACLIRDCDGDASGAIFSMAMERCGQGRLPKRNDRASHGPKTPLAIRRRRFKQPDCELYDIYRAAIAPESRINWHNLRCLPVDEPVPGANDRRPQR